MSAKSLQQAPKQRVLFAFYYMQPNAIAGQAEFSGD